MAQLADELQPIEKGSPIIAATGGGSDGLGTALSMLSRGIDGFSSRSQRMQSEKASQMRLAEQTNEKTATTDAISAAVDLQGAINAQPVAAGDNLNAAIGTNNFADAISDSIKAGKTIQKYQTASEQGSMPQISVAANIDKIYQSLVAKHGPTSGAAILSGLESAGVKGYLVQGLKDQLSVHDSNLKAEQDSQNDAYKLGMEVTGGGVGHSREEVISLGYEKKKNDLQLQATLQQNQILQSAVTTDNTQTDRLQRDTQDAFYQHAFTDGSNFLAGMAPQIQKVGQLALAGGPESQANFVALSSKIEGMVLNSVNQRVAQAAASGLKGDKLQQLRTDLMAQAQTVSYLYKGDASNVMVAQNAFKTFQSVQGLSTAQALPVFTRLRNAGIPVQMITSVMDGINSDPTLKSALNKEIKNLGSTDPAGPIGTIALNNIVDLVKGNKHINDIPREQAVQAMPSLTSVARAAAKEINNGSSDSREFVNSLGSVISATRSLSGVTGIQANYTAAASVVTAPARAAMVKLANNPATHDDGQALIMGSRAAGAIILGNMRRAATQSYGYYNAVFNKQSGQWEAKLDQKAWDSMNKNTQGPGFVANSGYAGMSPKLGVPNPGKPQIPLTLNHLLDTANRSLDHLVATSQYDKDSPKGSPIELRRWYSSDAPPASMNKAGGKGGRAAAPASPDLEYQKAATALEQQLNRAPDILHPVSNADTSAPFSAVKDAIKAKESGGDYSAVVYGTKPPKPVTSMTLGEVYKYQKEQLRPQTRGRRGGGDIGSTGVGAYQFESETLRQTAESLFGADWRDKPFTPSMQDQLAEVLHGHAQSAGILPTTWAAFN